MKKKISYSGFILLVIALGLAGWLFHCRNGAPPRSDAEKITPPTQEDNPHPNSKREYTQEEKKQIHLAMIEKNPELWRSRYTLGGIYLQEGDYKKAAEQFKVIIKIRPQMVYAYNALGMCYLNLGKNTEAITVWEKSLKIDPDNASARDLIARIEKTEERAQQRRHLEKTVEKDPEQADAWSRLGNIYLKEKLYDRAINALKKASQLKPEQPDYLYRLGQAYHRTRYYDKAEVPLKKARILDPQNDKIENLLQDVLAKKAK